MEDEVADRVCHHDGLRRHGRETVFGYLRLKGPTTISASPKTMMAGLAERRDGLQGYGGVGEQGSGPGVGGGDLEPKRAHLTRREGRHPVRMRRHYTQTGLYEPHGPTIG